MITTHTPDSDDLHWTAFLYASNELEAVERKAFEGRLAADESAQQALAEIVGLTETIAAAGRCGQAGPVIRKGPAWQQWAAWVSIAAAACLVLALGIESWFAPTPIDLAGGKSAENSLALAWSETYDVVADLEIDPLEEPLPIETSDWSADENASPDWMLAGVSLELGLPAPESSPEEDGGEQWE